MHDARLDKIRKLLAQAEDPAATPGEAAAFTAKAAHLMAQHGIDRALVESGQPDPTAMCDLELDVLAPYAAEKATLGQVVAGALRCAAVRRQGWVGESKTFSLHVFGRDGDLALFEMLFTSLLLQGSRELTRTTVPFGEHPAAYRRTWWLGFASSIESRLREAEQESARESEDRFAAAGTSASLVLADQARQADEAMRAAYPHLRSAAPRRLSGGGITAGWRSGQRADLGRDARLPGRSRGRLGA